MKIIQANKFYFPGRGAETYLFELSNWLTRQGHEVIPFAMQHPKNQPTPYAEYFPSFVPTEDVSLSLQSLKTFGRMFYSLESKRKISKLVKETKPDLCHIHNIYTQLSSSILFALHEMNIPVVMTVHDHHLIDPSHTIPLRNYKYKKEMGIFSATFSRFYKDSYLASFAQILRYQFERYLAPYERFIDLFFVPSNYLADRLKESGFPEEKIQVNYFGKDSCIYEPDYKHKGYILFVGSLIKGKGVEMIINIARRLPELSFKIVGKGPDEFFLQALAKHEKNIEFTGFQTGDNLARFYKEAFIVLVPSQVHDVFPLVTLEAMLYGKPVIASRAGGIIEAIEDKKTGFLVDPFDENDWIDAIEKIVSDSSLWDQFAKASYDRLRTVFSEEKHYERVMKGYKQVLDQKKIP